MVLISLGPQRRRDELMPWHLAHREKDPGVGDAATGPDELGGHHALPLHHGRVRSRGRDGRRRCATVRKTGEPICHYDCQFPHASMIPPPSCPRHAGFAGIAGPGLKAREWRGLWRGPLIPCSASFRVTARFCRGGSLLPTCPQYPSKSLCASSTRARRCWERLMTQEAMLDCVTGMGRRANMERRL